MKIILSVLFAFLLAGCSAKEETAAAEKGAAAFHRALNSGEFDAIYARSDGELRRVASADEFKKLLTAVHTKLGKFRSGKTVGWNVNYHTAGTYVTLNQEAMYERGKAQEQFLFKLNGEDVVLVGYHINSNDLIAK